jgi:hypothetical protein
MILAPFTVGRSPDEQTNDRSGVVRGEDREAMHTLVPGRHVRTPDGAESPRRQSTRREDRRETSQRTSGETLRQMPVDRGNPV